MPKDKQQNLKSIRADLYIYLAEKGFKINETVHKKIRDAFFAYDEQKILNLKEQVKKSEEVKLKISSYIAKANKLPALGLQAQAEVKTLKLVLGWLNSDAE